jgi:hypothetical protein
MARGDQTFEKGAPEVDSLRGVGGSGGLHFAPIEGLRGVRVTGVAPTPGRTAPSGTAHGDSKVEGQGVSTVQRVF